jgi:tetratricopeptide (TPR) repeat protein
MALLRSYDSAKFRTLLHVYRQTADPYVSQRALVGWTMALKHEIITSLYPEDLQEMEKLLEDKTICQELLELQHQIYYCINAEKDNRMIQEEIMPDLLQNSKLKLTRNGVEEIEEDTLNDILHPDEEERRMEQLEEGYQRMQNMQKQGSDIYFGGFSQMKRFPFFQEIVNWFVPYYQDHPGIAGAVQNLRKNRFLSAMMNMGPFCNSDKYSFVLAFSQVIVRIPPEMREMMEKGEAAISELNTENTDNTAFIRRSYLQDLYRFYRLYPYRSEFLNPFEPSSRLFFANSIFQHTHLEPYFNDIAAFLIKQKREKDAFCVLSNCGEARRDFRFYMMAGYLASTYGNPFAFSDEGVVGCYQKALTLKPGDDKAMQGFARALFNEERYEEALVVYNKLLEQQPDSKSFLLNRAVCLTKMSHYQEAQKDLFRLNYEMPDDQQVNRVLAWTLTCDEKYEQAIKIYSQLLTDHPQHEDMLNYGYCLWLNGQVGDAADCFHRFLKETNADPSVILQNELELLTEKGITEPEMQMMLYLL